MLMTRELTLLSYSVHGSDLSRSSGCLTWSSQLLSFHFAVFPGRVYRNGSFNRGGHCSRRSSYHVDRYAFRASDRCSQTNWEGLREDQPEHTRRGCSGETGFGCFQLAGVRGGPFWRPCHADAMIYRNQTGRWIFLSRFMVALSFQYTLSHRISHLVPIFRFAV